MKGRVLVIRRGEAGRTVGDLLKSHGRLAPAEIRRLRQEGRILLDGRPCLNLNTRLRPGQRLDIRPLPTKEKGPPAPRSPQVDDHGIHIRHVDPHILVVDKPAGLTTVRHKEELAEFGARARRYLPPTLVDLLPRLLEPRNPRSARVRAVHRLDRETSGLLVLARTPHAEAQLGRQFRAHTIDRRYRGIVRGRARDERIESWLVRDRGDGRRGSSPTPEGQHAVTHVRVLEYLGDFTLVECRLETGRTHQVRIHLGERGTPLCGERVYDRPRNGLPLPDVSGAARPALHAASLAFAHPATRKRMQFSSPLPKDMRELLKRLRHK